MKHTTLIIFSCCILYLTGVSDATASDKSAAPFCATNNTGIPQLLAAAPAGAGKSSLSPQQVRAFKAALFGNKKQFAPSAHAKAPRASQSNKSFRNPICSKRHAQARMIH